MKDIRIINGYKPNLEDFYEYSKQSLYSLDNDPVYPVLKEYFDSNNYTLEERLFGTNLYVTLYNTAWTIYLLEKYRGHFSMRTIGNDDTIKNRIFKYGSDRRGLSWKNQIDLYQQLAEFWDDKNYVDFFTGQLGSNEQENFEKLWKITMAIPNNGMWAAYKLCDMLLNVCGLPIEFTDFRTKNRAYGGKSMAWDIISETTGNKVGKTVKETSEVIAQIEEFLENAYLHLNSIDKRFTRDVVETTACNYHAVYRNSYYAGADIDEMYEQLHKLQKSRLADKVVKDILTIRSQVFDKKMLREHTGMLNGKKGFLMTIKEFFE